MNNGNMLGSDLWLAHREAPMLKKGGVSSRAREKASNLLENNQHPSATAKFAAKEGSLLEATTPSTVASRLQRPARPPAAGQGSTRQLREEVGSAKEEQLSPAAKVEDKKRGSQRPQEEATATPH